MARPPFLAEVRLREDRVLEGTHPFTMPLFQRNFALRFTAPADAALVRAGVAQTRSQMFVTQTQCDTLVKSLVEITALLEADLDLFTQALVFSWVHFRGKWLDARV